MVTSDSGILGRRIAVGYADGSIKVFDLKTGNVVQHLSGGLAHSNAVSSIDCHRDNNLIITGSLDGTTKLYNAQTGKVSASHFIPSLKSNNVSISSTENCVFSKEDPVNEFFVS